jgi:hypothetical protein
MLHMFHTYVATVCTKMFQLFQSYVAASGFMLQVLFFFGCFMCSTNMLQVHVLKRFICFKTYIAFSFFHVTSVLGCSAVVEPGVGGWCARHAGGL